MQRLVNSILCAHYDDLGVLITGLRDGDFSCGRFFQVLELGPALAEEEAVVLLGDDDGGAALGLEPDQDLALGPKHRVRLPGDEEGEAAVLAAAHLYLSAGLLLDRGQFLVLVRVSESINAETLPLLRRDVEHLQEGVFTS